MNTSLRLPVVEQSQAGEARRLAAVWAKARGCGEELAATVALVVTELATNLARHTTGGVLLLRNLTTSCHCGIEILSLDGGPGVANFGECLRDGFSTSGTAGTGLGAVRRASHVFEVHSQPGIGTALLSEVWAKASPAAEGCQAGAVSVPLKGEEACGDSWALRDFANGRVRLVLADGLGHGEYAAAASRKAIEVFVKSAEVALPALVEAMHAALRGTRGAALAIAEINLGEQRLNFVGVGNISATISSQEKRTSLVSLNGTAGVQYRQAQQFSYPWTEGATLLMHSDGVKPNWDLQAYLGLSGKHPAVIAGVLYRDFQRPNDDSTIVVLRPSA